MKFPPNALSVARGMALGLWILCGLAFLLGALLPGSAGEGVLGPLLLSLAAGWTALLPQGEKSLRPTPDDAPRSVRGLLLVISGALFAFGASLTIIREGDIRSFLFVAAVVALALTLGRSETGSWYALKAHARRPRHQNTPT